MAQVLPGTRRVVGEAVEQVAAPGRVGDGAAEPDGICLEPPQLLAERVQRGAGCPDLLHGCGVCSSSCLCGVPGGPGGGNGTFLGGGRRVELPLADVDRRAGEHLGVGPRGRHGQVLASEDRDVGRDGAIRSGERPEERRTVGGVHLDDGEGAGECGRPVRLTVLLRGPFHGSSVRVFGQVHRLVGGQASGGAVVAVDDRVRGGAEVGVGDVEEPVVLGPVLGIVLLLGHAVCLRSCRRNLPSAPRAADLCGFSGAARVAALATHRYVATVACNRQSAGGPPSCG